jgi:glycosyltransferase involved in cell wall biosynthesis
MRILVVHHRYRVRGGEDQAVDREVALLRGGGEEVELWERDSREITGVITRLNAALELPYSEQSRDELYRKLESYRPDVVHVHNWFPTFTPSIYDACIKAGIPVVQTLHNFRIFCASGVLARDGKPCELCLGGNTWPAIRYACYQDSRPSTYALTRMIDQHREQNTWNTKVNAFIALSEFSAGKLAQGGLSREKIRVKPNFAFPPAAELARKPEGYALYVGRLSKEKGVKVLLDAWEESTQPLWIVGDGPLRSELEARKNPKVRFMGAMPSTSVARIMSRAEFLVVPSECYENFPLVAAEAFSMGLPVIASRLGSLAEIVRDGVNGISFTAGSAAELREQIRRVSSDAGLRARLAEGALADYSALYTPSVNLELLRKIYRGVIA